jgi:hypothetical protein
MYGIIAPKGRGLLNGRTERLTYVHPEAGQSRGGQGVRLVPINSVGEVIHCEGGLSLGIRT